MSDEQIKNYPPAEIGGPTTQELAGLFVRYRYSKGREYELRFEVDRVTFIMHFDPNLPSDTVHAPGTLPYLARRLRPDLYLVHWVVRTENMGNIHVALMIDLEQKLLHVSALMPFQMEFFDIAQIDQLSWHK